MKGNRFESIDEVHKAFTCVGCNSIELTYNGKEYFLSNETKDTEFTIALNHQNENPIAYNSLDELLDTYKEDGIALRDFILDMDVEYFSSVSPDDV